MRQEDKVNLIFEGIKPKRHNFNMYLIHLLEIISLYNNIVEQIRRFINALHINVIIIRIMQLL